MYQSFFLDVEKQRRDIQRAIQVLWTPECLQNIYRHDNQTVILRVKRREKNRDRFADRRRNTFETNGYRNETLA